MRQYVRFAGLAGVALAMLAAVRAGHAQPPAANPYGPAGGAVGSPVAAFPAEFDPWPNVSPYDNNFVQHLNVDGLWVAEQNNEPIRSSLTLESLVSRFKRPEQRLVGSFGAPRMEGDVFSPIDLGAFWAPAAGSPFIVPLAVSQVQEGDPIAPGIRAVWAQTHPDGSGVELSGYWSNDSTFVFRRGFNLANEGEPETLRITAGIPLDDGMGGSTVPYDEFFEITHNSEAFEANLQWLMSRAWTLGSLEIQPTYGLRYLFIRERFWFQGRDSGLAVAFFPDGTPDLSVDPVPIVPSFDSYLRSAVRSHLVGPQVGVRYGMGGELLKITGSSLFGILANREEITLHGNAIGDGYRPAFMQESPFWDKRVHTHVSPMLEQTVNADMKLFGVIPILRRLPILEEAKLRVGYSITGVWEVARPGSTIFWQGLPRYPRIQEIREKWYIQSWHFGIHWEY